MRVLEFKMLDIKWEKHVPSLLPSCNVIAHPKISPPLNIHK